MSASSLLRPFLPGLLLALAGLLGPSAQAQTFTFDFTGEVTDIKLLDNSIQIGDAISGRFSFEATTPDTMPGSTAGGYVLSGFAPLQLGTHTVSIDEGAIAVLNDFLGSDSYGFGLTSTGALPLVFTMTLVDADGAALSSDALPLSPPFLPDFETQVGVFVTDAGFGAWRLTDLSIYDGTSGSQVPEPGSLAMLLGLSVTGIGFAARRRK